MDNLDYLNQISAQNRPIKKKNDLLSNPILKYLGIGFIAIMLIIFTFSILSSLKGDAKKDSVNLAYQINNTSFIASDYHDFIKSSKTRSANAILKSILSNLSRELNSYMYDEFEIEKLDTESKDYTEASDHLNEVLSELYYAYINGTLDYSYPRKINLEIDDLIKKIGALRKSTDNNQLKATLDNTVESLNNVYEQFELIYTN